jgi:hypothetical protein
METCNDKPTIGFKFYYADATSTSINFSSCTTTTLSNVCGNFIGMLCSWKTDSDIISFLNGCGAIYDKTGQTFTFLPFENVVYSVGSPALTTSSYDTDFSSCRAPTY